MKLFKKVLVEKHYEFIGQYISNQNKPLTSYCKITACFDFKDGLRFVVQVPNVSYCERNIIKALVMMIEHENVKGIKYDHLNDDIRKKGLHRQL